MRFRGGGLFLGCAGAALLWACPPRALVEPPPDPTGSSDGGGLTEVDSGARPDDAGGDAGSDAGLPAWDGGSPDSGAVPPRHARANPIPAENAKPGSPDWQITQATSGRALEGYSPHPSVLAGEAVPFAISVQPANETVTWRAYRLGFYGNLGAREVARSDVPTPVTPQPECPLQTDTGLVACHWNTTLQVQTGLDWVPGLYLLRLTNSDHFQRYIPFFIRDDSSYSDILVDVATGTWAAYNAWGGESLYSDEAGTGLGHAFQVSFDKPYDRDLGAGQLLEYEHNLVKWIESQGLNVSYATTEELDRDVSLFTGPKVIIVPAHDEYWTSALRTHVDDAVSQGTSLLLFGANAGYWQIRMSPSLDGRDRRVITAYKDLAFSKDPVGLQSPELTCRFRDLAIPRPENALFGVMFLSHWNQWGMPATVTDVSHWAFQGTGFNPGDTVWQVAGYEVDQLVNNGFQPPDVAVLMDSPILSLVNVYGRSQMVVRQQGNSVVFAAGGIDFTRALASGDTADPRLQRLAANVLYRGLGVPVPEGLFQFTSPSPNVIGTWAGRVSVVAGIRGRAGDVDGPTGVGQFTAPTGVAVLQGGALAVIDSVNHEVKQVDPSGAIRTLSRAFDAPQGIVADDAGNIYVGESESAVIKKILPDGGVTVIAGQPWIGGKQDGPGSSATFTTPIGLAVGSEGLYVTDLAAGTVRVVDLADAGYAVRTLATGLWRPSAISVAPDGKAYVVETGQARVLVVSPVGSVEVVAGGAGSGYGDGPPSVAQFLPYMGIAVLKDGALAVSDPGNYRVRRVPTDGGPVTTLAGTGRFGQKLGDGGGSDLVLPAGLAVGPDGTLYVAESGNADVLGITP